MFHRLVAAACAAGLALIIGFSAEARQGSGQTLMVGDPDLNGDRLAFTYGGNIWIAGRDGSDPRRLTTDPADEHSPRFSPDGRWIAFSAAYDGNDDVYVIPAEGGQPQRLTWHPGGDRVQGWTPDGRVLFSSGREVNHGRSAQLWSIAPGEGYPRKEMEARFFAGDLHADGNRLAYISFGPAYNALYGGTAGWRQHRGGTTPSINVLDMAGETVTSIPGERVNDINPIWMGDDLYFLSDRDDVSLALYRSAGGTGEPELIHSEAPWDIVRARGYGDTIVFAAGGRIKALDTASGAVEEIVLSLRADLPQLAERWVEGSRTIQSASISPTGVRAVFTARGEVFTVPVDEGSTRNISNTPAEREYTAIWSPQGNEIAFISDAGGRHHLRIVDQRGFSVPRERELGGDDDAFYTLRTWSPDGSHIAYTDNHLNLYVINVESGESRLVGTQTRRTGISLAFSPDSRWLAWTLQQRNYLQDVVIFDMESGENRTITDGMADAGSVVFSRDGKYLYFTASTNTGPRQVGLNMSTQERPARFGIYAAVLASDGRSPLLPGTGDEAGQNGNGNGNNGQTNGEADATGDERPATRRGRDVSPVRIDFDGLDRRIVALPLAERAYDSLMVAHNGDLYFMERPQPGASNEPPGTNWAEQHRLRRFSFSDREASTALEGVSGASLSHDGRTFLLNLPRGWATAPARANTLRTSNLSLSGLRLRVDPRTEWAHIFDEAWRMQAQYFYDPNLQGLDWQGVRDRYEPLLEHVARREDLNALIAEMIGELQAGHNRIGGGDIHRPSSTFRPGFLGADFEIAAGRYRITRIYTGERWNPFLEGPLAAPGLGVEEGDYILAINGRPLTDRDNIFAALEGTSGEQVTLLVNSAPRMVGAREIIVRPIGTENQLRLWGWVEANRRAVEEATDGRVGYIYLPNTAAAGYTFFNRMYYAQFDRDALIIDERSNGGGQAANYITDILSPFHLAGWLDFAGLPFNTPAGAHYGPKTMLIDQDAGSGGDFLPYSFRARGIGPLIGTRTWGGLIGISTNPPLIDGGVMTVPYFRFYTPEGEWTIENEGVAPDIEVQLDPVLTNQGRDSQLERAIAEMLESLEDAGPPVPLVAPAPPTTPGQ